MKKKALILVNLGTPDAPKVTPVRKYLSQFLNDRRVIDLPWIPQKLLVNLIIVPFRAPKSTKLYQRLWTDKGSPLSFHLSELVAKVHSGLKNKVGVYGAMRYGNPSLKSVLEIVRLKGFNEVVIIPLFPQYASSTTGSVVEYAMGIMRKWNTIPSIRFVNQFYQHPGFIAAFSKRISSYHHETYDHILFSFHGLPLSQVNRTHPSIDSNSCQCEEEMTTHGRLCYKATCYETARLLAVESGIDKRRFSVAFQSRLTKKWLSPFADEAIVKLAQGGVKKLLVVAPSFVADCLETTVEISMEYNELFKKAGGQELVLVESLNSSDAWVNALIDML